MAYGTKYTTSFYDPFGRAIRVDLKKDGYSGSSTSVRSTGLSIRWEGDRDNIFHPVRGALATLVIFTSSTVEYSEFFEAKETEWLMVVSVAGSTYWTGYMMPGYHQESWLPDPYPVTVKAYDIGYLKDIDFDNTREDNDSIIDVIQHCLSNNDFGLEVKERVNVFEDSITSGSAANSMLNQINLQQRNLMDDDWVGYSCYDVLERVLRPFNAILMQENNYWNIVRVPDMKRSHYYRVFNTSGSVSSSGTEDTTTALSGLSVVNRSGVMMAVDTWKTLNMKQDLGIKNLVNNGRFQQDITLTDFWTKTGAGSYSIISTSSSAASNIYGDFSGDNCLYMDSGTGSSSVTMTHDMTYSVVSGSSIKLKVRYRIAYYYVGSPSGTPELGFFVTNNYSGTNYRLQMDGSWASTNTDTDDITPEFRGFVEGEIISEPFGGSGTLSFIITDVRGLTGATAVYTMWDYFEVIPVVGANSEAYEDYTETLDADNLTESDEIVCYFGDSEYSSTGRELLAGSLETTAGATTDIWQSTAGSPEKKIVELCADCYKAQRESVSRKFQSIIRGQLDYLDVIYDSDDRYYFPSSMTYDMANSEWQGERIEIKTGWGDNLVDDGFTNGGPSSNNYDTLSQIDVNEVTITKTQTSTVAQAYVEDIPISSGVRYRVTVVVEENGTSDIPEFTFAGDTTQLELGTNEYDVISTSTSASHDAYLTSAAADTCNINLVFTIQEAYGL